MLFSFLPCDKSCLIVSLMEQCFSLFYALVFSNLVSNADIAHHAKISI